jgi:hypothetical protein
MFWMYFLSKYLVRKKKIQIIDTLCIWSINRWSCRNFHENHRPVESHWQTVSHNVVSSTPPLSVNRTHKVVVIDTDCIGSYKSNYHKITATMAPLKYYVNFSIYFMKISSFSSVSSSSKTDLCTKTDILLKVALNTITLTLTLIFLKWLIWCLFMFWMYFLSKYLVRKKKNPNHRHPVHLKYKQVIHLF